MPKVWTAGSNRRRTARALCVLTSCGVCAHELLIPDPMYHSSQSNISAECPICRKFCDSDRGGPDVHIHNRHGPLELREPPKPRFAAFAWVVCMDSQGRFLMVNEPAGIAGGRPNYWLPAGRVDEGESFTEAAVREALEEAGVHVQLCGVLRLMLSRDGCPRAVLLARPSPGEEHKHPKSVPDFESVGAMWVQPQQLNSLSDKDYRSPDPAFYFPAVASGQLTAHPVDAPEFLQYNTTVKRLTAGDGSEREMHRAWDLLKKVYPADVFREH
eukprot:TRINITY_DN3144_c0_g2_i2.p1 TRINITY_DN3144_c0_g2~~TRINITY_DN3144_c0_g2_i2.p1  ORF type:complete len:271 (+),score=63.15 TRINITY_DN3144_c0_g2_i2:480-1292(+)